MNDLSDLSQRVDFERRLLPYRLVIGGLMGILLGISVCSREQTRELRKIQQKARQDSSDYEEEIAWRKDQSSDDDKFINELRGELHTAQVNAKLQWGRISRNEKTIHDLERRLRAYEAAYPEHSERVSDPEPAGVRHSAPGLVTGPNTSGEVSEPNR